MTGNDLEPVRWRNGALEVVDQTLLPTRLVYVRLGNVEQVCAAIKTMRVRGAPLIGVVGAYGLVLSVKKIGHVIWPQLELISENGLIF